MRRRLVVHSTSTLPFPALLWHLFQPGMLPAIDSSPVFSQQPSCPHLKGIWDRNTGKSQPAHRCQRFACVIPILLSAAALLLIGRPGFERLLPISKKQSEVRVHQIAQGLQPLWHRCAEKDGERLHPLVSRWGVCKDVAAWVTIASPLEVIENV